MGDCGDERPLVLSNLEHLHHKRDVVVFLKPIRYGLCQYRRREWTERLTPLNLGIEDRLHISAAWIPQDRPISKCTGPPLHAALKPTHYFSLRDGVSRSLDEFHLVFDGFDDAICLFDLASPRRD